MSHAHLQPAGAAAIDGDHLPGGDSAHRGAQWGT
jgi:hypothetical protein